LFDAANRDARMAGLYATYLDAWKASGAQLFVHYTHCDRYSPAGRWGSLEYLEQPRAAAPKFDALQSFIERNPAWWCPGARAGAAPSRPRRVQAGRRRDARARAAGGGRRAGLRNAASRQAA